MTAIPVMVVPIAMRVAVVMRRPDVDRDARKRRARAKEHDGETCRRNQLLHEKPPIAMVRQNEPDKANAMGLAWRGIAQERRPPHKCCNAAENSR